MLKLKLLFFLLLISLSALGQNIKGIVYDVDITLKGIQIVNLTQNKNTITNDKGEFSIAAKTSDTLEFRSSFHNKYELKVHPDHFKDAIVIELKQFTNQLDQVLIYKTPEAKVFNVVESNASIHNLIAADIKNHPYKYGLQPSSNLDFMALAGLIGKLFKNKRRSKPIALIEQNEIVEFFNTNDYFNDKLLAKDLKINLKFKHLFLEYFIAQNVPKAYLETKHKFQLLDELMTHSLAFNEILENYQKD